MGKSKGRGKDSGLGREYPNTKEGNDDLNDALITARLAGNTELVMKILREKNRGLRNKKKKCGGPNMRGDWGLFFLPEIIRNIFEYYEN